MPMLFDGVQISGGMNFEGAPAVTSDPYFYYNSLLLPGNGTNNGTNNTFIDGSTNNFTITRNGNTTQGTVSPFSLTGWSNYFDGTGDYLSVANNAALNPGTEDFVMEAWVYLTGTTGSNQGINGKGTAGTDGYSFYITNGLVLSFIWNGTGGATITAGTLSLNTWNHVAVVRNSNVIRLYLNGVGAGSSTSCTTNITSTAIKYVGQARGANPILGYISNYRMVKGALPSGYDATLSSLTPPTSPLTAVSNTSLLTCQSNRFIDNSTNNFAITVNGDTSVQSFSPFNPTVAYSTSTVGGSGYFDGTGDYLSVADNIALDAFTDFTIEGWVYFNSAADNQCIVTKGWDASSTLAPYIIYTTGGNLVFSASTDGSSWAILNQSIIPSITTGRWYHFAVTRSGSTVRYFNNGALTGTSTVSAALMDSIYALTVGSHRTGGYYLNGYLSGFRIVKGTAVYTSAFTPPTSPPTDITNTSLLLNFTNGQITDATSKNVLETVGDAKISTTQSKFGGSSIAFDGTGDYLVTQSSALNALGSGDFTIEMWLYPSNTNSAYRAIIASDAYAATTNGWTVYQNGTSIEMYYSSGGSTPNIFTATSALTSSVWQHFALVRSSGTLKAYVNGTQVASVSNSINFVGGKIFIGDNNAGDYFFNGYIDDLRITKGYARYTTNFTPPTEAFPVQ